MKSYGKGADPAVTLGQVRTFLYGCAVEVIDVVARPVFWLIHWRPKE